MSITKSNFLLKKLGFIGGGNMTEALIKGLLASSFVESKDIFVSDLISETELWLMGENLTKEDYENKTTEMNGILNPIMMKIYSEGAGSGAQMPEMVPENVPVNQMSPENPTIDEVD